MFIEPGSSLPHDATPQADRHDGWLDDALQAVPLPAGFLERVGLLAADVAVKSCDRDDLLAGHHFSPNGWRRA